MSSPPPLPRAARKQSRWWLSALLSIILLPVIAAVATFIGFRVSTNSSLKKLEREITAAGEPLSLAELQDDYRPIPDEENAAVPLLALWEAQEPHFWKAFRNGTRPLPRRSTTRPKELRLAILKTPLTLTNALSESDLHAAKTYLREHQAHMEQVRTALQRPHCRFPVQITNGLKALLPHIDELRTEAKRFHAAALVAAHDGQLTDFMTNAHDVARIASAFSEGPLLIDQLVRISCLSMVLDETELLLARNELTTTELAALAELLDKMKFTNGMRRAFIAERASLMTLFDAPAEQLATSLSSDTNPEDDIDTQGLRVGMGLLSGLGLKQTDQLFALETLTHAIRLADNLTPEALNEMETLFADERLKGGFPPRLLTWIFLPPLRRASERAAVYEARRRSAATAVAVEMFRRTNGGRMPESLGNLAPSLMPSVPNDPFSGEPVRFAKRETGYAIYSLGPDRRDGGGQERSGRREMDYDVTFAVHHVGERR